MAAAERLRTTSISGLPPTGTRPPIAGRPPPSESTTTTRSARRAAQRRWEANGPAARRGPPATRTASSSAGPSRPAPVREVGGYTAASASVPQRDRAHVRGDRARQDAGDLDRVLPEQRVRSV